jgi:hypothetical protein
MVVAVLSLLALAACQPVATPAATAASKEKPAMTEAEKNGQDDPGAPFKPAPVGPPKTYEALSKTAMSFTPGVLTITQTPPRSANLSPGAVFAFGNGITYETTLEPGAAREGGIDNKVKWAEIFIDSSGARIDPDKITLYSVDSENIPPKAANGGLCKRTSFLATYLVKSTDAEDLTIAAFDGNQWPPKAEAALCGTFTYSSIH